MKIANRQVPYADRLLTTPSGFALIWPFTNVEKGAGPYELFLDNNSLLNTQWLDELPANFSGKLVINPWLAFVEQWVSNAEFRSAPAKRIAGFIHPFQLKGIQFPAGFSELQAKILRDNDQQLRTQWYLPFLYITILKKLIDEKQEKGNWRNILKELGAADVPRFSACLILSTLILNLKKNQSLAIDSDKKPLLSYLDSFFAYQPKKKQELPHISEAYLRNRAGDLAIWYLTPTLLQQSFKSAGEAVIVTRDKALHKAIFRVIPPMVHPSGKAAFSCDLNGFNEQFVREQTELFNEICSTPFNATNDLVEQQRRLFNLHEFAKTCCTLDEERSELDATWEKWFLPGNGKPIKLPKSSN